MGLLNTRNIAVALIVTALCLGCSTRLDRHRGESQRALTAMQIAHPDGAPTPEAGIDGATAEGAIESLRAGDGPPAPQPTLIQIAD